MAGAANATARPRHGRQVGLAVAEDRPPVAERGLDGHVEDDQEEDDEVDPREDDQPPDPALRGLGALGLDQLLDPARLGPEERGAGQERDREQDQPDHDPVLPERPEIGFPNQREAGEEGGQCRGHERPVPDSLDVPAELRKTMRVVRPEHPEPEELDHRPAADPDDRRGDMQEEQELVERHAQNSFCSLRAAPMSPSTLSLPVM